MWDLVVSRYTIRQNQRGWFTVYKRCPRMLSPISTNITDRLDAEWLVTSLAFGGITEQEARKMSVLENALTRW